MPHYTYNRPCRCGSGLDHYPLIDAAGIFCAYVCEKCEEAKKATYKSAIFNYNGSYAATGDERDIDIDTDRQEEE